MRVTEQTKAHAQDIVDFIIEHPEQHNQRYVWAKIDDKGYADNPIDEPFCGTALCAAGTSIYLTEGVDALVGYWGQNVVGDELAPNEFDWEDKAARNLGLNPSEASNLFYCMDNSVALDALIAISSGDEQKFHDLVGAYHEPDDYPF